VAHDGELEADPLELDWGGEGADELEAPEILSTLPLLLFGLGGGGGACLGCPAGRLP